MHGHEQLLDRLERARSWEAIERILISLRASELLSTKELLEMLAAHRTKPGVAALMALLCADSDRPLTDYFPSQEVEDACVLYLERIGQPGPELFKTSWAWWTVCFGPLPEEELCSITLRVISRAPDDDVSLWLIGDGPLARLFDSPGGVERLNELAEASPRVRLALRLAAED